MNEAEGIVRGFFGGAINTHDLDACAAYCSDAYVWHGAAGDVVGLPSFKAALAGFFAAFPDVQADILDLVAGTDRVAIRYRETATHRGDFMGVAATGVVARWEGMAIYRASHGLLVEEWSVADTLSLLTQIGASPATVGTPTSVEPKGG